MSRPNTSLHVLFGWGLGFALATLAWFVLSPHLSSQQENLISRLLAGSTIVIWGLWLFSARQRKADEGPAS